MSGLRLTHSELAHKKLQEFLEKWPLERLRNMKLEEYTSVGSHDTFCYWIEHETERLGRIGGSPSSKFEIWMIKDKIEGTSEDFLEDEIYKWRKKYGNNAEAAFLNIRKRIVEIAEAATSGNFQIIDGIKYFALTKWKIAFLYSNYSLMPIYKNTTVRKIAKHFEFPNYTNDRLSKLHTYIVDQKEENEDFFEFAWKQYDIATHAFNRNYYVIGSKYGDGDGNNTIDISKYMYQQSVIATGFFWETDFSKLYRFGHDNIYKWIVKNIKNYGEGYESAKRTLGYFLGIKVGDIIAVKSHGQFGDLTIIAYAEVISVDNKVYEHKGGIYPEELGHIIHVNFLETNLRINTGLSYGQTIHKIVPGAKQNHFEKIFGSYALLEKEEEELESDFNEEVVDFELTEEDIRDKQTEVQERTVSYTTTLRHTHNKIQIAFAKALKRMYPSDIISTEKSFIDIVRQNEQELFYYEVKPYNTAYSCIRAGIGQLLDYYYTNPNKNKKIHLVIVGNAKPTDADIKFIDFIKSTLNTPFSYQGFYD